MFKKGSPCILNDYISIGQCLELLFSALNYQQSLESGFFYVFFFMCFHNKIIILYTKCSFTRLEKQYKFEISLCLTFAYISCRLNYSTYFNLRKICAKSSLHCNLLAKKLLFMRNNSTFLIIKFANVTLNMSKQNFQFKRDILLTVESITQLEEVLIYTNLFRVPVFAF